MGLDYETISAINPRIILAMTSTFGSTGPYKDRVGFDTVGQAMSGSMHLTGDGSVPMRVAVPVVDYGTAMLNTIGIMAALMDRQKSGKGQLVETALLRTALNYANTHLIEQALIQANRQAITNRGWTAGPQDCFKTRDGWIYSMCIGNPLFKRWARMMGDEKKWTEDPRFKDDLARGDNGVVLSAAMQEWCLKLTTEEALAELAKARIPAGPVYTPQQALDDPHVREAGFFQHVDYPGLPSAAPTVKPPVVLSRTPAEIRRRPPVLGEHTGEMMQALGYSESEIAELRDAKVI
jgi:crotonobetainyl-CoA:carnitine CoA-transferase CaiB-like acyl-CoA transferase